MTTLTLDEIVASTTHAPNGGAALAFYPVAQEIIARSGLRAEYVWEERNQKLPAVAGEAKRKTKVIEIRRVRVTAGRELRDLVADICAVLEPDHHTDPEYHYEPTSLLRSYALHWNRNADEIKLNRDPAWELANDLAEAHLKLADRVAQAA